MQVTKNITLDLLETGSPVIIKAKQNDRNTRYIAAHLYVDGLAYPVPSGTEIAFRYKKPDGTAGFYDALPDNSPAITVSGNTVTVELVEQVLTAAGCVHCEINMYNAASEKLTTFTFEISVEESVLTDAEIISSDYYNVLTAEIAKALQAVTDATEQAENAAQSAQDAADSAAMSKDWAAGQPVTYSGTPVSIAYAGTNRIASITAYGETPQGGTTEDPVALTGISSVTVNDDVTELPIPRPLRRVGDVRDVCRTRVKSIYDKRIVLDGSEDWKIYLKNPNSFRISASERIVKGLSDSYPTLKPSEIGTQNGIYLSYTLEIIVTDPTCSTVEELKAKLAAHPITVYYQSTAYDGTNGLDVCLTEYQTGFVELDGTENWQWNSNTAWPYIATFLPNNNTGVAPVCSHYQGTGAAVPAASQVAINEFGSLIIKDPSWKSVDDAKAYLAAQKEAGTPVQVAYQLATPETYATDPVDFDNAAGPLTVMTGGEVEVRMTELVGSRSPELTHKLDKTGDGSNVTAAFIEAEQDADITSGEKLSVLFGKIKKRFSVVNKLVNGAVYPNLGTNTNFSNPINQRGAASYTTTTEASIYCIDRWRILKNTTYTVASFTLTAPSYAARACGMWQSNEMGQHQLSIGDDVTVSIYANGKLHTPTMKVIDRDLYDAFTNVPAGYDCDDFEIVLCTYARDNTMYNLGIYPKKPLTVNYIKWEKGSVATPYAPKAFGDEFLECLRYFVGGVGIGSAGIVSGSTFRVLIPTPVPMRTAPSVTVKVADNVVYNGTFKALNTTVSNITRQRNGIHLHIGMAASGVNNYPGIAYGLQCDLSADL